MDLLEKCKNWLKEGNYPLVIKTLELDNNVQMTPELAIVLARAYHGLAHGWPDRWMYERAIEVLKKWKEWGEHQYEWNLLIGIAYFNLDQKVVALSYFQEIHKDQPNDQGALIDIGRCLNWMEYPSFQQPFCQRVSVFWDEFSKIEAKLRKISAEGLNLASDGQLLQDFFDITKQAVGAINTDFEQSNGRDQLILSPGGDWSKFQELVFLQRHMPKRLEEKWECLVGYQPQPKWTIPVDDDPKFTISLDEVAVWLEKHEDGSYTLSAYCEKLVDNVKHKKRRAIKTLEWLVNVAIGELPRMYYFYHVEPLEAPKDSPAIPLPYLAKVWTDKGYKLSLEPSYYFINPLSYSTPVSNGGHSEIPDEKQRWDIIHGISNCRELLDDYRIGSDKHANALIADGAAPGFIFFAPPFDKQKEGQKNYELLDQLQEALLTKPESQSLTIVGASFGVVFWYLDLIAWDIKPVLEVAKEFFEKHYSRFSGFQLFMQNAEPLVWDGDKMRNEKDNGKDSS